MGFVSLKYDEVFKEVFSCEGVRKQFISDVTGIPLEDIREARLANSFLRRRHRRQKQGVLDIAVVLQDGTKVDIELQVAEQKFWIKRKLFYLARMYGDTLYSGEDYERLRKCIAISILDFSLTADERYYSSYRLRDKAGRELTDLFEVHIIELNKKLTGTGAIEDWIRLFNVERREDLDMIKTMNAGIMEAIGEMRRLSLGRRLRQRYEEWEKAKRDRRAEDAFVKDQGRAEGMIIGRDQGRAEGIGIGKIEDILELLEDLGPIPEELRKLVAEQQNLDTLKKWLKLAARVESVEEFRRQCRI